MREGMTQLNTSMEPYMTIQQPVIAQCNHDEHRTYSNDKHIHQQVGR